MGTLAGGLGDSLLVGRVFVLGTVFGVSGVDGFSGKRDPDAGFGLIAFWEGAFKVGSSLVFWLTLWRTHKRAD